MYLVQSCVYAGSEAIALICRSRERCGIDKTSNQIHTSRPRGKAMCRLIRLSQRNCRDDGTRHDDDDGDDDGDVNDDYNDEMMMTMMMR